MFTARRYTGDGSESGERELPIWLFDGIVNEPVLHEAIRAYQLNQRQGTASTKTRDEVRGGSRKPWRQKGTGRARHGSIRSPIWAGGGITFGPRPKSWRVDLPKKVKGLARRSAFNARAAADRVLVIESFEFEGPKTKRLRELLEAIGAEGKVLLLTDGVKEAVYLSGRNMPHVQVMPLDEPSAYHVLWATTVVIEEEALENATRAAEEAGLVERARRRIERIEERDAGEVAEGEPEAGTPGETPESEAVEESIVDTPPSEAAAAEAEGAAAGESEGETPIDPDEIELPTVARLADFLSDFDDVALIRALQDRDERKTAQTHYDARIEELTGDEEERDDA